MRSEPTGCHTRALLYRRGLQGVCLAGFALVSIPFVLFSNGVSFGEPRGLFPGGLMTTICTLTFTVVAALVFCTVQLSGAPEVYGEKPIDPWTWKGGRLRAATWLAIASVLSGVVLPVVLFAAMPLLMKFDSTAWGWGLIWLVLVLPASLLAGLVSVALYLRSSIGKAKAIARHQCLGCGYDLKEVGAGPDRAKCCPECGIRWQIR